MIDISHPTKSLFFDDLEATVLCKQTLTLLCLHFKLIIELERKKLNEVVVCLTQRRPWFDPWHPICPPKPYWEWPLSTKSGVTLRTAEWGYSNQNHMFVKDANSHSWKMIVGIGLVKMAGLQVVFGPILLSPF